MYPDRTLTYDVRGWRNFPALGALIFIIHLFNGRTPIFWRDSHFLAELLFSSGTLCSGGTLMFGQNSYFLAGLLFSGKTLIYWQDYYKRRSGRGPLVSEYVLRFLLKTYLFILTRGPRPKRRL